MYRKKNKQGRRPSGPARRRVALTLALGLAALCSLLSLPLPAQFYYKDSCRNATGDFTVTAVGIDKQKVPQGRHLYIHRNHTLLSVVPAGLGRDESLVRKLKHTVNKVSSLRDLPLQVINCASLNKQAISKHQKTGITTPRKHSS